MKEQFLRKYDLFIVTDACQKAAMCGQNRALKFYVRIDYRRLSAIIKCETKWYLLVIYMSSLICCIR